MMFILAKLSLKTTTFIPKTLLPILEGRKYNRITVKTSEEIEPCLQLVLIFKF